MKYTIRGMRNALLFLSLILMAPGIALSQYFTTAYPGLQSVGQGEMDFGDFDNDGDLDLLQTGYDTQVQQSRTVLYRNNGGSFTEVTNTGLQGVDNGGARWGDFDNDGWLDIALSGSFSDFSNGGNSKSYYTLIYRNNRNGGFSLAKSLTGLVYGSVDWGDYDGDGDLDLLVCGIPTVSGTYPAQTYIARNEGGGQFTQITPNIQGVGFGTARWGDYDRDGDLDILVTGTNSSNSSSPVYFAAVYTNEGNGNFVNMNAGLAGVWWSDAEWGDYDADGFPDILLSGSSPTGYLTKVYQNENGTRFQDVSANSSLQGIGYSSCRWADFNNDGFQDFAISGAGTNNLMVYIYAGSDRFTGTTTQASAQGRYNYGMAVGDYNQDNKLDIAYYNEVLENISSAANTAPTPPPSARALASGNSVLFAWESGSDNQTATAGLSYNIMVAPQSGSGSLIDPMADPTTGWRKVVLTGNAGTVRYRILKNLPDGTYYWKVQSEDAAFQGSEFTAQGTFTIPGQSAYAYIQAPGDINPCSGEPATLTCYAYPDAYGWQWYKNNSLISGANAQTLSVTESGNYSVLAYTNSGTSMSENTVSVQMGNDIGEPQNIQSGGGCAGSYITLSATPGTGADNCRWYDASGRYLYTAQAITVNPTQTTDYQVRSYNSTTECTSDYVLVAATVFPKPTPPQTTSATTCGWEDATLTATPSQAGDQLSWYATSTGGTPFFIGTSYTVPAGPATVTYYVSEMDALTGCISEQRSAVSRIVVETPDTAVVASQTRCGAGAVTLTATPGSGANTCRWYAQASAETPVFTGLSYTTPSLESTTPYFVKSYNSSADCEGTDYTVAKAIIAGIDEAPRAENQVAYGSGTRVSLAAIPPPGATTCKWYSDPYQHTLLGTGNLFLTPPIYHSTVFYVNGYDENSGCIGSRYKAVSVNVENPPSVAQHPDQVYPIPQNHGKSNYEGVNLFTGDVNMNLTLGEIQGMNLSYSLDGFYNSRSVGILPLQSGNVLGGLGWKLMDYPKIVWDEMENALFYLDGMRSYKLDTTEVTGSTLTLSVDGENYLWKFTLQNANLSASQRDWLIETGDGIQYMLPGSTATSIPSGTPGYLWHLSKMRDSQHTDSLSFTYSSSGKLQQIQNAYDESLVLSWSGTRISEVVYNDHKHAGKWVPASKTKLNYSSGFILNPDYSILTSMERLVNVNEANASIPVFVPSSAATDFQYSEADNPGALSAITTPAGAIRDFTYMTLPYANKTYYPVKSLRLLTGDIHRYGNTNVDASAPTVFGYEGVRTSPDGQYLWANVTEMHPGEDMQFAEFEDQYTSFETGVHDAIFRDLDADLISRDYALSGSHSYFVNQSNWHPFTSIYIHSKEFYLTPQQMRLAQDTAGLGPAVTWEGARDSVELSFFAFDTHEDLKVDIHVDFVFHDANGRPIPGSEFLENPEMDNDKYGKWVPFHYTYPIPNGAVSFEFVIWGGDPTYNYDFYLDNVAISGAAYTLQGEEEHYFFNGAEAEELRHLTAPYLEENDGDSILKIWYTGFEDGQDTDGLIYRHDNDCKPKIRHNSSSRQLAFNGTAAYRMKACDEDGASLFRTYTLDIPAGTDEVEVAFRYSNAMIEGMQLEVISVFNSIPQNATILSPDASFYEGLQYESFAHAYPVPSNARNFQLVVGVSDQEGGKGVNECFLDDFTISFITRRQGAGQQTGPVDVTDPLLVGAEYHARMFDVNFEELQAQSAFLVPSQLTAGTRYLQLREENNTNRSVAHSGVEYAFNDRGLPVTATSDWIQTAPDSSRIRVLTRDIAVYASEIYPALSENDLRLLDEEVVQYSQVTADSGQSWQITTGTVTQWKAFTPVSDGGPAPSVVWAPWRHFVLTQSISETEMDAVIQGLSASGYTPPSNAWALNLEVTEMNATGQATESKDAVGNYTTTAYSTRTVQYNGDTHLRAPTATHSYYNAATENAFFFGFEPYASFSGTFNGSVSDSYAHTGTQSATGSLALTFQNQPAKTAGGKYVFAAWMVPATGTYTMNVRDGAGNTLASQSLGYSSSQFGEWRYVELVFDAPESAGELNFAIAPVSETNGTYYDDVRFSPVSATLRADIFDPTLTRNLASIDNNGQTLRNIYRASGGLRATTVEDDQPFGLAMHYDSRMGQANDNTFNPSDPNANTTVAIRGDGRSFHFDSPSRTSDFSLQNGSFGLDGITLSAGGRATMAHSYLPDNREDCGISFTLAPVFNAYSYSSQSFRLDLGGFGVQFQVVNSGTPEVKISLKLAGQSSYTYYTSMPVSIVNNGSLPFDCDLVFQGGHSLLWVNGVFIPVAVTYSSSSFSQVVFSLDNGPMIPFLDISNVIVYEDGAVSAEYADGAGNVLQEQRLLENELVVSENLYDRMSRPVLMTKEAAVANALPGFRAGFVTSFNWETGEMRGEVEQAANYAHDDNHNGPYMYHRSIYQKSPQTKLLASFNPGYNFALRPQTNFEKATTWAYEHTDDVVTALGYAMDVVDIITEPESAPFIIAIDVIDLVSTYYMNSKKNDQKEVPVTSMYYDKYHNLSSVKLPRANLKKDPDLRQEIQMGYDFFDRIESRTTPEAGDNLYCWDVQGNLRFMQDGNLADKNRILFYQYDNLGRLTTQGYFSGTWNEADLQAKANVAAYPARSDGAVVTGVFLFDGTAGTQPGEADTRGRLTSVELTNEDGSHSVERLAYDQRGRVTTHTQVFTDSAGVTNTYSTTYTYDVQGNNTRITYPEFSGQGFSVTYSYGKNGLVSAIQTSRQSGDLVTYSWNPDGSLASESLKCKNGLAALPVEYLYNAPGWLTTIGYGSKQTQYYYENGYNIPYSSYEIGRMSINYNFLLDWWSELWGQAYYNGNISAVEFSPQSSSGLESYHFGYNYDDFGRMSEFYSSEDDAWIDYGFDRIPFDNHYDINGNLSTSHLSYEEDHGEARFGWTQHVGLDYNYIRSNSKNRLRYMASKYYSDASHNGLKEDKDTLHVYYDQAGRINSTEFRDWTEYTKGDGHGSLADISYLNLKFDDYGRLYRSENHSLTHTGFETQYRYNSNGLRIWKFANGNNMFRTTTHYIHGQGTVPLMEEIRNYQGDVARYYVQGPTGTVAMFSSVNNVESSWFILQDHLGSPVGLLNRDTRRIDAGYAFDAWGNLYPNSSRNTEMYTYWFTGQEFDLETGLYNFKARMYHPKIKQFLTPDPAHTDWARPYAYAANDPANHIDPTGRLPFPAKTVINAAEKDAKVAKTKFINFTLVEMVNGRQIGKTVVKPRKSKFWKIEFRRRVNLAKPETIQTIRDLRKQGGKPWRDFKEVFRPGGMHEMLPVSRVPESLELGFKLDDIQEFTIRTSDTKFSKRVGREKWEGAYGHHGTKEGKAAHNDFYNILERKHPIAGRTRRLSSVKAEFRLYVGRQYRRATHSLAEQSRKKLVKKFQMVESDLKEVTDEEFKFSEMMDVDENVSDKDLYNGEDDFNLDEE